MSTSLLTKRDRKTLTTKADLATKQTTTNNQYLDKHVIIWTHYSDQYNNNQTRALLRIVSIATNKKIIPETHMYICIHIPLLDIHIYVYVLRRGKACQRRTSHYIKVKKSISLVSFTLHYLMMNHFIEYSHGVSSRHYYYISRLKIFNTLYVCT